MSTLTAIAPGQKTIDVQKASLQAKSMQPNIFLEGNFAPIKAELTLNDPKDFVIKGKIPRELHGSLYRNGPNPAQPVASNHHWFLGDGMIHAFHFNRGAVSYRNVWVRTPTFKLEQRAAKSLFMGPKPSLLANVRQYERFRQGFHLQVLTGRPPGSVRGRPKRAAAVPRCARRRLRNSMARRTRTDAAAASRRGCAGSSRGSDR